jgi:hypothetical protein
MILTPGQLYFINEEDIITGKRSSYYKIGIVRGAADRDSKDRLLEHQTGNPRKLCIVETIDTPAVEAIETNLHYLFARNRVMGEWMSFTEIELQSAIEKAQELSAEILGNIDLYESAERLKNRVSSGFKITPTEEAEDWFAVIQDFKEVISACEDVNAQYFGYLHSAITQGVNVAGKAKIQKRSAPKKFNEVLFIEKFPELYKLYSTPTYPVRGSFRLAAVKDWNPDLSTISDEQVMLLTDFKEKLDSADHSLETGFALHGMHLGVLEIQKYAEWQTDVAKVNLRVLTGESDGIEGICTWKREKKEIRALDKDALQAEFPDEYAACIVEGKETQALIVEPKIAAVP